ncbi:RIBONUCLEOSIDE-DIPHOSPHATE REDUCTASE SMALL CHAIN A [Salix koriyanagi]|uniref:RIBONUCLEOSIDE-DIPHOSPHATE REDUCTASE SMALL CHAIN A n=1 Tax=Salix koriyanagi TaxID=2511006 RepID=A0A9Q0WCU1_9ROSI|nr:RIBONUCLEOSIDE-DIPHOSPHATE REDUCTASE SMALL CHAIN A [Salix koriyanagi]
MGSLRNGTKSELNREEDEQEPILKEQNQRFCMFPIRYKELWEMYKKAEASFWTENWRSVHMSFLPYLLLGSSNIWKYGSQSGYGVI